MPVRRRNQLSSMPKRSAISRLVTTRSGSAWPRPRMLAVRSAGRAGVARNMGCSSKDALPVAADALLELRQHGAGARLDEALDAGVEQRVDGGAPAHRPHERAGELLADIRERAGARAGEHGEARVAQ